MAIINFFIDDKSIKARKGESILQAGRGAGLDLPGLCYRADIPPTAICRGCLVEIEGEEKLTPACRREALPGMRVSSQSPKVLEYQMAMAVLAEERPAGEGEKDLSHHALGFDPKLCIACGLCVTACQIAQGHDVLGFKGRGETRAPVFDFGHSIKESRCVACGECVEACPTQALFPRQELKGELKESLCPYCGVGCRLEVGVKDGQITGAQGGNGPANQGRLCVKGRFGLDYVHSWQRLTKPLRRIPGSTKGEWAFTEVCWDEALDFAAQGFAGFSPDAIAGIGSAKGSNEEAYLLQKLIRQGLKSPNVDHCARLCHSPSVTALLQMLGSGAVTAPFGEVKNADMAIIIGSNPAINHPVAASFMRNAAQAGTKLVLIDPRKSDLAYVAHKHLPIKPGGDIPILNALAAVIIEKGLENRDFINLRVKGFSEFAQHIQPFTPEWAEGLCGISAQEIRQLAIEIASSSNVMFFWGMGATQHEHGVNNIRSIVNLALITGQVGRPGTGLHPLRGQNNVQGACDAGLLPGFGPGYNRVDPGLSLVEMFAGQIKAMLLMGENPVISDPDSEKVKKALARMDHLVVVDIFPTETAHFADVILPGVTLFEKTGTYTNTNRQIQLAKAIVPPQAWPEIKIFTVLAQRLGLDWNYTSPEEVWEEFRDKWPLLAEIPWNKLEKEGFATWGAEILMEKKFQTPDGLANLALVESGEQFADQAFPLNLITGRMLELWHTGEMSRRSAILNHFTEKAFVWVSQDLLSYPRKIKIITSKGEIILEARPDASLPEKTLFLPFGFGEAPANSLLEVKLDPEAKMAALKNLKVKISFDVE